MAVTKQTLFELIRGNTREAYAELLRSVIEQPDFQVVSDDLRLLWQRYETGDLDGVKAQLPGLMRHWIHNPEIHIISSAVARRTGDLQGEELERLLAHGCFAGMQASGDGSLERPYQVARVYDEYSLLRFLQKKLRRQRLLRPDGRVVDELVCDDNTTMYFELPKLPLT